MKSGKFSTVNSPFNFAEMVESTFDLISIQMDQKRLRKIIEIDPSIREVDFISDRQRLSQIFVNLLSNALKFTF